MTESRLTDSQIKEAFKRLEADLLVPGVRSEMGINATTFCK